MRQSEPRAPEPGSDAAFAPDAAQRQVLALAPETSAVVVGAPGTGKTATLVARVRALVDAGVDPDTIVVLTSSRTAATALRDRLALAVGRATAGPLARSVASLAFQLVRAAAVHGGGEPPQLLTGADEDQLLQDLLAGDAEDEAGGASRWPEWLPAPIRGTAGFRAEVRTFLAECTTLGVTPARLGALARRLELPAWESLASFATEYERVRADMRGAHRDAAGLVREAVGILRTSTPGAAVLGPFAAVRVLLVDDAQELTLGGVELLEACRAHGIAVMAFGDPDVGSGTFRGASPRNFARLAAAAPPIVLTGVHRGTPAQRSLLASVTERIGAVGIVSHRVRPAEPDDRVAQHASVRAFTLRSPSEEFDAIARLLRERHLRDGVPWDRCAVIAHDTRQVSALEAELAAREVPARASGPGQALGVLRPVRDLLRVVELSARPTQEWTVDDVTDVLLGVTAGMDPVELRRLRTTLRETELAAGGERSGHDLLVSGMARPLELELIDTREARRAARVAGTLAQLAAQHAGGATVHEMLWTAWERAGLQTPWAEAAHGHGPLAEQANRDLDAVVALFQAAKRAVEREDGAPPLAFVRGILDSDVAEDRLTAPPPEASVRVLTPAGSLGLEFDTVVVAGVQDGVWPNTRLRGSLLETWRLAGAVEGDDAVDVLDRRRQAMHDELRLFARAVSRATSQLIVTAVDDDDTGPSVLFELLPDPQPAPREAEHPLTLRGLVALHRRALTDPRAPAAARAAAAGQLALLADAGVAGADPAQWYGVAGPTTTAPLRDLDREDVRVSPSRLQALEQCQLDWVIAELGGDAGGAVAGLGTLIHAALEHGAGLDEEGLWDIVQQRWKELDFDAAWRDRAERTRARDLVRRLHRYLRDAEREGVTLVSAEPHFEVPIPLPDAGEHTAVLSGYIDRVEIGPDGSVVIVDLKTGKTEPQTDKAVADNPQLAAYQLAFESGAVAAPDGARPGGAKLLVLRPTAASKDYVTPRQLPFDDDSRAAFVARVVAAVDVMRGTSFVAPYEEHCRDEHSYGLCRIHTIGAVSS
ncbi:ATP-dependent helicase [Microbacterium sp. zg.Y625]|uniref:ATP-dependent helicase n=1 Tax=Microbacterium jiangjiandongii TaxID=3049071 RepID=UPI00214CB1F2|nr:MULTISPECIES: ATP-dependent DNA helicase [unclassified Microbacterium]MCR2793103.1 ATP-dependent helicase [Microbacterium sp. zg.Y625]WIM24213.1 ATP-dependent DNA helicase [Microbacterium sp. zg-Y625]